MEYAVLGTFCAGLLLCIVLNISIIWALTVGLLLFMLYGRRKGFSWRALMAMALKAITSTEAVFT